MKIRLEDASGQPMTEWVDVEMVQRGGALVNADATPWIAPTRSGVATVVLADENGSEVARQPLAVPDEPVSLSGTHTQEQP